MARKRKPGRPRKQKPEVKIDNRLKQFTKFDETGALTIILPADEKSLCSRLEMVVARIAAQIERLENL